MGMCPHSCAGGYELLAERLRGEDQPATAPCPALRSRRCPAIRELAAFQRGLRHVRRPHEAGEASRQGLGSKLPIGVRRDRRIRTADLLSPRQARSPSCAISRSGSQPPSPDSPLLKVRPLLRVGVVRADLLLADGAFAEHPAVPPALHC